MKNLFLLGGLCLITSLGFSQKTDKTDCGMLSFIQPPADYVLTQKKSYVRHVTVPSNAPELKSPIESEISLSGFDKTDLKNEADFTVFVTLNQITYEAPKVRTVKKVKEEDGVKKEFNRFVAHAPYKILISSKVVLQDGTVIHEDRFEEAGNLETTEHNTAEMAKQFFGSDMSSHKRKQVTNAVKVMNAKINDNFCHLTLRKSFELVKVKPKKFDYDDFNKGVDILAEAVPLFSKEMQASDEIKSKCIQAIDLWKKELTESNVNDKKARINANLTSALYFNIGMAYFLMEEYEHAITNLEESHKVDGYAIGLHSYWIERAKSISTRLANKS